ncbi:hypothetical protein O181_084841 [Austropuccinia psidii MF-1]|uniref:Uncharacterized protein n=1 Tax=Austropuccinia psidii MF-1 TaxID=1389203 RepID=A0A9Q3IJ61_9BASI|nr:hypothetical protein [Austropuccinia psidii MF-1]
MKNCGMNANEMESGDFTQEKSQDNNDLTNKNNWNRCGDNEGENGHSDMEEEGQPNDNTQGTDAERNQPGPLIIGQNTHAYGRRNQCRSISQYLSISFASTRHDWGFLTNMNNNMQGMLCPLMMMMQQNQERAEERDSHQMERDEEKCLQEEFRHMEDESH